MTNPTPTLADQLKMYHGDMVMALKISKEKDIEEDTRPAVTWRICIDFIRSSRRGGTWKYYFLNDFQHQKDKDVKPPVKYYKLPKANTRRFEKLLNLRMDTSIDFGTEAAFGKRRQEFKPELYFNGTVSSRDTSIKDGSLLQVIRHAVLPDPATRSRDPKPREGYVLLTLADAKGEKGHNIVLGMRPDSKKELPYEYFDPEIGYLLFKSFNDLVNFITRYAYPENYSDFPVIIADVFLVREPETNPNLFASPQVRKAN